MDANIRWMIRRDLPEVVAIENLSFEFPWTADELLDALGRKDMRGMVAEFDDEIVGFMFYGLHEYKLHLLSIAAHWQHRNCGIGYRLIEKLKDNLFWRRRNRITVDVRETNLSAQLFFKACGFEAASIIKSPFSESTDDAYRLVYRAPANCLGAAK